MTPASRTRDTSASAGISVGDGPRISRVFDTNRPG
jgi:hypothetical protein